MHPSRDPLTRWLEAEAAERPNDAEEALSELFEALPSLAPPAGFADRVLARLEPRAARAPAGVGAAPVQRWLRWVVALCLLAMATSLAWVPPTLSALSGVAGLWSLAGLVRACIDSLVEASLWLASAFGLGQTVLAIGEAVALSLARPQVFAFAAVCLLISATALRFLRDLVSRERTWVYVDSP